jgi:CBS domain-containing protein
MKAQDVMTQHVISVGPNDLVARAVRAMLQNDISGLPVLNAEGQLVGMVTEGDLLHRAETGTQRKRPRWLEFFMSPGKLADEYVHTHGRKVSEVMTADPVSVVEETPLEDVVAKMEKRRIKRIPVVRGDFAGTRLSASSAERTYFMPWRGFRAKPSPRVPMTKPFVILFWRSSATRNGPPLVPSTSSYATVSWTCGARSPTSANARLSLLPPRMFLASRPSRIISRGSTPQQACISLRRKNRQSPRRSNSNQERRGPAECGPARPSRGRASVEPSKSGLSAPRQPDSDILKSASGGGVDRH